MLSTDEAQNMIFLDKSALIAYMDPDHPNYRRASSFMIELDDLDRSFVTSNAIVFSIHQWLRDTYGYVHAEFYLNILDKAEQTGKLFIIPGSAELEIQSREALLQYAEYQINLEEALIAAMMNAYRINRIFTFNKKHMFLMRMNPQIKVIPSA